MKSSTRRDLIFGSEAKGSGKGWRVSVIIVVIEGWERAWTSTSWPMKPVVPVRMSFMVFASCVILERCDDELETRSHFAFYEIPSAIYGCSPTTCFFTDGKVTPVLSFIIPAVA